MKNLKKIYLSILSCCLLLSTSVCNVAAAQTSHNMNDTSTSNTLLLYQTQDEQYYLEGNNLIKVEINSVTPLSKGRTIKQNNNELTKEVEADINIYTSEISEAEKKELIDTVNRSGSLSMSNQNMNAASNIKVTLSVTYSNSASGISGLHMCKATGTYEQLANNGVVAQSSSLYWNAGGKIYSNGVFVRNGSLGTNLNLGKTFSNVQLMPEGTCINSPLSAGATYTLYCTRSVTIPVQVSFY